MAGKAEATRPYTKTILNIGDNLRVNCLETRIFLVSVFIPLCRSSEAHLNSEVEDLRMMRTVRFLQVFRYPH